MQQTESKLKLSRIVEFFRSIFQEDIEKFETEQYRKRVLWFE